MKRVLPRPEINYPAKTCAVTQYNANLLTKLAKRETLAVGRTICANMALWMYSSDLCFSASVSRVILCLPRTVVDFLLLKK